VPLSPSVSVIIPTYNAASFIGAALESIFAQTRLPNEVIVVDDCSTDGTVPLVRQIAANSPVPILVTQLVSNSGGPAKPLAAGFGMAKSDFIAVLDQDDVYLPNKLADEVATLNGTPQAILAFGAWSTVADPKNNEKRKRVAEYVGPLSADSNSTIIDGGRMLSLLMRHGNFVIGWPGFVFRRSALTSGCGIDESLRIAADFDFLCQLAIRGSAIYLDGVHYLRREHANNMCRQEIDMHMEVARVRARYLRHPACQPCVAKASGVIADFTDTVYLAREAGRYGCAWSCLFTAGRTCGWPRRLGPIATKLFLHQMLRICSFGRWPRLVGHLDRGC